MSRIVAVLFLVVLAGIGVFLFTQLDTLKGVLAPNEDVEDKRAVLSAFVEALRTGETRGLAAFLPTQADIDEARRLGAAVEGHSPDALRAQVHESIATLRETTPAGIRWNRIRLDARDDEGVHFLALKGEVLGDLYFRIRCGPAIHELRVRHCMRLKRGWVAFGRVEYGRLWGGSGCGPLDETEGKVTFSFTIEYRATPATERPALAQEVLAAVRGRLRAQGFDDSTARLPMDDVVAFDLPPMSEAEELELARTMMRKGTLEFRLEVLSDAEYARRVAGYESPPKRARTGVWPADALGPFDAFKRAEIARWREQGASYVPSDHRFRLVKEHDRDGSKDEHFHVVEAKGFDRSILEDPVVGESQIGRPVVTYSIREEDRAAFSAWTAGIVGLPMAILVDGEFRTAPTVMDRLDRNVQISLGRGSNAQIRREAEALVALMQSPGLPLPLRFRAIERRLPVDPK